MIETTRLEALTAARAAVRAYARNPSDRNAAKVEAAWTLVRRLDAVAVWRQPLGAAVARRPRDRKVRPA